MALVARAPAKVNVALHVGPRRGDGLHEICSLLQSVTLADEVRLESSEGDADEVVCPGVSGFNLAALALQAFREGFGWNGQPQRITIVKRIPIAAGLGGGSADAAAVLRLACAASGVRPGRDELLSLAMSLGADVPSQVEPGTALVRGAGERVERLASPARLPLVVLVGGAALSTGDVYARADELRPARRDLDEVASSLRTVAREAAEAPAALAGALHNDLESAALELAPSAGHALELLRSSGALGALVSGSGPAAFGVYASSEEAEAARAFCAPRWSGDVVTADAADAAYAAPSSAD